MSEDKLEKVLEKEFGKEFWRACMHACSYLQRQRKLSLWESWWPLTEFVSLVNAHVPLKCKGCNGDIDIEDNLMITPEGVYHWGCYEELFPDEADRICLGV